MKNLFLPMICLCCLAACTEVKTPAEPTATVASVNTDTIPKTAVEPDSATKMKNWQDYMTPGEEHQLLKEANGKWDAEVKMWMAPGTNHETSTVVAENKMILGGRYQQTSFKGTMMGMPFEGLSTLAFDKARKKFISTFIDNMGTGMMVSEGTWDGTTKTINFKGTMIDPSTYKDVPFRETFTFIDKDHHLMQMYGPGPDGKEFKTMEIMFVRKR